MAKIKAPKSKRMSSKQRHKIERKKREHTRDLRKAAKALKKTGAAPTRSKKSRDMAKLALKISNAHPDKEQILRSVLHARENARVEKAEKKLKKQTSDEEAVAESPVLSTKRNVLLFPVKESNSFPIQFERSLNELVFPDGSSEKTMELPSAAYVVTLDSRFSVQCMPWTLIDAIVEQGREFAGKRKVLVLFVLTKCDLISAPALVSQLSLVAFALKKRYPTGLGENIVAAITLFSIYHDKFGKHLLRLLRQFQLSDGCSSKKMLSNLDNKVCAFVIGLPNTGRHSLRKALATPNTDSSVSVVPLRAAQLQLTKATESENSDGVRVKFAIPLAKSITFVSLPEDASIRAELKNVTGGDILFRSPAFIERTLDPEAVGMVLFDGVLDQVGLAQAFCQPFTPAAEESGKGRAAESFLRNLGRTVRQDKGFYVSPLFSSSAGSMGKLTSSNLTAHVGFTSRQQSSAATLLDASFSNATPSKLVRISSVITPSRGGRKSNPMAQKVDSRNALRLGARTFLREMSQGRNVPWAVMRAPGQEQLTPSQVAKATEIFDLSLCCGKKMGDGGAKKLVGMEHMTALLDHFASLLKDVMPFLPNGVVEINPDSIVPPQYALGESPNEDESNEGSDVISCGSENDSGANEDSDEDVEDTE